MCKKIWLYFVSLWRSARSMSSPALPKKDIPDIEKKYSYSEEDLDLYEKMLEKAAREGSSEVFPNHGTPAAVIVMTLIFTTAKSQVVMTPNGYSHEVLDHPRCIQAMQDARKRNVRIVVLPGNWHGPFYAWNDKGILRHERCHIGHRANVYFP